MLSIKECRKKEDDEENTDEKIEETQNYLCDVADLIDSNRG
jgi:hypothetical protein